MLRIAVTGTSGYLGSLIAAHLKKMKHQIFYLSRHPNLSDQNHFFYSLNGPQDESLFKKIDALIHCAHDFTLHQWNDIYRINVEGSKRLIETAKRADVKKIIFISSMSAFEGCQSFYGKAKLEIEKITFEYGGFVIRPGLVFGPNAGGMMGSLIKLVKKISILPLIEDGRQVFYMTHESDLTNLVDLILDSFNGVFESINAANEQPVFFRQILETIGIFLNKQLRFVSLSKTFAYNALKFLELLGFKSKLRSDGLISLLNQNSNPNFELIHKLSFTFRPFNSDNLVH